ncbi:MAG: hypothetical protein A3K60_02720 [Euryarchaeota archaeon RBG_19FT_COMBO_56_21]|nr:MAG: hypothetical protein A3K60_02720 [Euryarchaeota archaeon RBG_19FT_COMBO_56_21]
MAKEAFPYGRGTSGKDEGEMTMKGYVESSLLYSTWSEVACIGDAVVGFLFGRIEKTWKGRSRMRTLLVELSMTARFLLRNPLMLARSFGLMWNVWITELKLAEHRPRSDAEIELLIVDSKNRGEGIGKDLVDRFITAAKEAGAEVVTLYSEDLQSNYQFYEKYGFRRVATFYDDVTSYFANKASTAIIYALDLKQSTDTERQ